MAKRGGWLVRRFSILVALTAAALASHAGPGTRQMALPAQTPQ